MGGGNVRSLNIKPANPFNSKRVYFAEKCSRSVTLISMLIHFFFSTAMTSLVI